MITDFIVNILYWWGRLTHPCFVSKEKNIGSSHFKKGVIGRDGKVSYPCLMHPKYPVEL